MQKGITIFPRNNFVSQCQKNPSKDPSMFHKSSGIEQNYE